MTDPQTTTTRDEAVLDHERIPTWPPLKKALWDVVTGEKLNDGHYINAYQLTDKLYAAAVDRVNRATDAEIGGIHRSLASAPAPASGRVDAVLRHYADTFCELGSDHECCGKLSKDECSGCLARSAISPAATPVSEAEPVATVRTIQPLMCEAVIDFIPKQNGHLPFDVGSKLYALAKPASSPAGGDVAETRDV